MDFHSLARRDLQFLCKKNRVPANLTNVAMAKALEALETVEGIEEIQEALGFQSPKVNSPELPRTDRRTSSRGVTHGDEPKIQQQQQPSPLPQLHCVTIKTPEITELASKEDDIEETLGFQSLNLTSPELPPTGRMTSVRRAALGDEPKIQHQKPSPLYRSRQAAAKELEVTEMASNEEERKNKEIPTILSKTPATRKATKVVEAHSSNRRAKKNKEIESHTETPTAVEGKGRKAIGVATRRSTRLSSRKALEETATTQSKSRSSIRENSAVKMEPLAKEDTEEEKKEDRVEYGDSCAVIVSSMSTRRSTRLSSRKALEETATTHSKSRSSSKKNSAVKMEPLAKEDTEEQEKEEKKEDRVEYGDSCAVIVEEHGKKDQEAESNEFPSFINGENSKNEVENECEATHEYVPLIQQQQPSLRPRSHRVSTKAREVTKMASKEVDDKKKAPKLLPNTRGNTRLSSRKTVEARSGEQGTVKMVALTEEYAEQAKQKEKKDLSEKSDSCVVDPVEEDEVKDKNEENHGYSSSIEVEKGESIVALFEEDEENGKEVEILGFSSSVQGEDTNNEVENGDSAVVIVEDDAKNDQELEIQAFSSPIEGENSNVERKNDDSDVVLVEEEGRNDQGESHGLSFLGGENSKVEADEAFESIEDSGDRPPVSEYVSEYVKDSSDQSPENEFVEVSGDHSPKSNLVEDSSKEISGELLPANGAVEDTCDHSSDAKLAIYAVSDSFFCGEMRPLLHEEAVVCTQGYSKIDEEEEGKLSMLFTEMTLKEPEDAPLEPVASQDASFVPTKLPAATVIPQYADLVDNADIVIPQDDCSSPDLAPALDIPPLYSENVGAITNLGNEISATEAIRESPEEVQESGSVLPSKIAAVTEESIDDDLVQDASFVPTKLPAAMAIPQYADLVANADIVIPQDDCSSPDLPPALDIPPLYSENVDATEAITESPDEVQESGSALPSKIAAVTEESIDDDLPDAGELITNCSVDVKGSSFEPRILVCSAEFSTADPAIGFPDEIKESSGHLPTESLAVIKESFEDNLTDYSELAASNFVDLKQKGETLEGSFFELHIPELCPGFSTIASTIELASVDHLREIPDESLEDNLHKHATNESFDVPQKTEISQCDSFEQHSSVSSAELCSELSTVNSSIEFKDAFGDLPCEISAVIDESVEADLPNSGKLTAENSQQIPVPSTAEIGAATDAPTMSSTPKLPCESESMSLEEVQTQSSEETSMAVTETKTKALDNEVFLKDENLELLSLTKLRSMYKQILNGTKTEQERKESIMKQEDLSSIKQDENCKQKLNDDMIKSESKKSVIKQEDLECLSRSKLDSNKQKLNDDKIKSERKRTPLKSLNYSTF